MVNGYVKENIGVAYRAVKSQILRTVLTASIIAIGLTALIGILTAIDSLENSINDEFTLMGTNTYTIRKKGERFRAGRAGKKAKAYPDIDYREAVEFKERTQKDLLTSISINTGFTAIIKYGNEETNPNIIVTGIDENYLETAGLQIDKGRGFSAQEVINYDAVAIIGHEIGNKLFAKENPVGKVISVSGKKLRVVGVLKEKGSSVSANGDRSCLVPISTARAQFLQVRKSFLINVFASSPQAMEDGVVASEGLMRLVRGDALGKESSFEIRRSDNLVNVLLENLQYVSLAASAIGFITLLGAAIALMNIMLVTVTERIKEIGTRKALGARKSTIRSQFLIEAIMICQLGGVTGIILGIIIGNVVALLIGGSFFMPWQWIFTGISVCFIVGVLAGFYPANRAAKLDPVEALRYE